MCTLSRAHRSYRSSGLVRHRYRSEGDRYMTDAPIYTLPIPISSVYTLGFTILCLFVCVCLCVQVNVCVCVTVCVGLFACFACVQMHS